MKIKNVTGNYKIYYENDLEEYRIDSFFTKEAETVSWIQSFNEKSIFFDIGANIGIYSIYASLNNKAKTYAFEPYYKNYVRLIENINLNEINDICFPLLTGLHKKTMIENCFISDERSSSSGHQIGTDKDENGKKFDVKQKYPLLIFSIDDFINIFEIDCPNHIKIDVDGCENEIIEGMKSTLLNKNLKSMCIELNMDKESKEILNKKFLKLGFTTENEFNSHPNHSRIRRQNKENSFCENVIYTRIN